MAALDADQLTRVVPQQPGKDAELLKRRTAGQQSTSYMRNHTHMAAAHIAAALLVPLTNAI